MREAMERTGLAAIGKYVMRERQYLGCLRVRDGVIALEKMFFHDEIRPSKELAPGKRKVPKEELELATALIERFTGTFEPEKYEDTYRKALLAVVRAKQKGKTITAPEPEPEEEPTDLLALKASSTPRRWVAGRWGCGRRPEVVDDAPEDREALAARAGSRRRGDRLARRPCVDPAKPGGDAPSCSRTGVHPSGIGLNLTRRRGRRYLDHRRTKRAGCPRGGSFRDVEVDGTGRRRSPALMVGGRHEVDRARS
jgi:DNA end-binding protein Ku